MKNHTEIARLRTRKKYIERLASNTKMNGEPRGTTRGIPVSHLLADPVRVAFGPRILEAQIRKLEEEA